MNSSLERAAGRRRARDRRRGSALVTFVFVMVVLLALVGLALQAGLTAHTESANARARVLAREAAEAGASLAFEEISRQWTQAQGFTTTFTTNGGHLKPAWSVRQRFGQNSTWKALVTNNADTGGAAKDTDDTVLLYVTGRCATPSGGDAVYNLVKTIQARPRIYPAIYAAGAQNLSFQPIVLLDPETTSGKYGDIRANGSLSYAGLLGSVNASQTVTYGGVYAPGLGSISPAPTKTTGAWPSPTTPAAIDVWNKAVAVSGSTNYKLDASGFVTDMGSGVSVNAVPGGWSGWTYSSVGNTWTHASGNFAPGNAPATFFGESTNLAVTGGNAASASFLAQGSVSIAALTLLNPLQITPLNGVTVFADQDVSIGQALGLLSTTTLGNAAAPGFIVAGGHVTLDGGLATTHIGITGSVVGLGVSDAGASSVQGSVSVAQDSGPNFILGPPLFKTAVACEVVSGPNLPVDASEGPLGVYR